MPRSRVFPNTLILPLTKLTQINLKGQRLDRILQVEGGWTGLQWFPRQPYKVVEIKYGSTNVFWVDLNIDFFLYISIHSCTIKCTCTPVSSLNLYNKYRLNSSDRQDLQVEPYLQWGLLGFITFRLQFVPSQSQQSALLQVSLQLASVSPGQISYSEICPCVIWAVCVVCPCVIWNRTRWPKVTAIILSLWSN